MQVDGRNDVFDPDDDDVEDNNNNQEDSEMGAFGKEFLMEFLPEEEDFDIPISEIELS